ncbi:MAG: glycosyltransferase family 4 protein [Zavarzinella sp.]|nr:glycosyltransferase family 4 protein [Zavarzinella sp.]
MRRLRVLTWHVHGNYLLYLSQAGVDFYLPVVAGREGYGGRGKTFPFGPNVHDIPAEAVRDLTLDCVLYQTRRNFEVDGPETLSGAQRKLPRIYLQHDPPWDDPVNEAHWSDDPDGLLVHVTPFNALMWDSGRTPSRMIDHGVFVPEDARFSGEVARGLVVINHLRQRGRRLGADVFRWARERVPLDLVGLDAESLGGIGEVFPPDLPHFAARYRFLFNPIRWTSLGLAVIEAMMVGLPVVGLATTELPAVIEHGVTGFVDTDPAKLVGPMRDLIADAGVARRLGENARRYARERFGIERFVRDWERAFADVCGRPVRERAVETSGFVGAV